MSCESDHMIKNDQSEEDPFDSIVMMDTKMVKQGFKNGIKEGEQIGLKEGESLGKSKGAEISKELGFYYGYSASILALLKQKESLTKSQSKALGILQSILDSIKKTEMKSLSIANVIDDLDLIKSQFKQVTSLLRLKQSQMLISKNSNFSF